MYCYNTAQEAKVERAFICMLFINIDLGPVYTEHVFAFNNARRNGRCNGMDKWNGMVQQNGLFFLV